jgi:hypothetical protein
MRRFLGYAALLMIGAAVTAKSATARTSSLKNRYESNYTATWRAINTINGQFTASQIAFIQGLSPAQAGLLGSLSVMTAPTSFPLADDGHSGSTWQTGERDYVNSSIDMLNDIILKLQRNGYMS